MAKPVGSLVVRIGANTSGLTRGGRRMETTMQRWRRQANETSKRMAMIGGAAAAAATAITAKLVSSEMKAIDATAKLAARVGATTEEITGLQHAAELTGSSAEQMGEGLNVLSKRLGEAAQGSGEAANALDALGLNVQELIDKRPGEQMRIIADAMQGLSSQAERNAVASDLFSRANQDLVNTLAEGREGLDRMKEEARELGLTFSNVDARQVEAANDALTRVSSALTGLSRRLTVELAPVIEAVANRFVAAAKDTGGFRDSVVSGMETAAVSIAHIVNAVKGFQIAWEGMKLAFQGVRILINQGLESILEGIRDLANKGVGYVNNIIDAFNKLPGIHVEAAREIGAGNLEAVFRNQAQEARESIDSIQQKMHELATSGADPEQIRKQFQVLREEAQKAAEEATQADSGTALPTPGGGESGDENREQEAEKRREFLAQRLEDIRKAGMSQLEIEQEQFEQRMEWLREAKERELITEQEFRTRKEVVEQNHQKRLTDIERQGLSDREKFERASMASRVKMMSSHLSQMSSVVAGENKRMFKLNKAAALAEATVSMFSGAEKTMAAYPYPWNIPMVAAHLATSAARIQKIKSTSFSGGGGGSTAPSVAGSTPSGATPTSDAGGGGGGGAQRQANITIQGDNFSGDAVQSLAEQLEEFYGDNGGKMNIRRAS